MSGRLKGRQPLIDEPFTVDITGVNRKTLRQRQRNIHHEGSGRRRLQANVEGINPNALIHLENNDSFCLFHAINILRAKDQLHRSTFRNYLKNKARQQNDVILMMNNCGIPTDRDLYSIEEFGYYLHNV